MNLNDALSSGELKGPLEKLQGYLAMLQLYSGAIKEITTKLEILDEEFQIRYDHNPIHHIENRLKSPQSMAAKLLRRNQPLTLASARANLFDIAGVRVVCYYIEDIYQMEKMLTGQQDIRLLRRRDYIAQPKPNGYRSLHLTLEVPVFLSDYTEQMPVEVQIRTIAMDFWASLEHQLKYKAKAPVPDSLHQRLRQCADKSAALDQEMQDIYRQMKKGQ